MAASKEKIIAQAEKLVSKGKIEAAIKEYQKYAEENPDDTNILNRIGDLYTRINRIKEAVKVFERIADHFADDGFYLRAIAILKKINKLDPSILEVYEKLGDLYIKQDMPREASSHFQYLADYYIRQKESEKARNIYEKIVQMDSENIATRGKLAEIYQNTGEPEKALEEYKSIGEMLAKQGHLPEAIKVFQQAQKLDPGNVELAKQLADTLTSEGKIKEAIEILKTASEARPDDQEIIRILLRAYEKEENFDDALETIESALAKAPKEINLYELQASILFKMKRSDEAVESLLNASDLLLKSGETTKVENLLQGILKKEPLNVPVLQKLLTVQEGLNQETNVITTLSNLVDAHEKLGNFTEAEALADRLVELEPDNVQHKEKLAYIKNLQTLPGAVGEVDFEESVDISEVEFEDLQEVTIPEIEGEPEIQEVADDLPSETRDFISERMVEVDVFMKYGLLDRAIEHLEEVINQVPDHVPAFEKLMSIHMQEGNSGELESCGKKLFSLLAGQGRTEEAERLKDQMLAEGYDIAAGVEPVVAPAAPVSALTPEELEEGLNLALGDELEGFVEELDFTEEEPSEPPAADVELEAEPQDEISMEGPSAEPEIQEPEPEEEIEIPTVQEETTPDIAAASTQPPPEKAKIPQVDFDSLAKDLFKAPAGKPPSGKHKKVQITGGLSELEDLARSVKGKSKKVKPVDIAEQMEVEETPTPASVTEPTTEDLAELDFYLDQELLDEARKILDDLMVRFPNNETLTTRRKNLDERMKEVAEAAAPIPEKEDGEGLFADEEEFFDLASELESEIGSEELVTGPVPEEKEPSLEEIFQQFKKGVEQQLSAEDYDTHYNLGIAYKEMNLLDEAISEFQIASKDPNHHIECCSMLGLSFLEKGMPQLAEKWYRKGLEAPSITEDEQLGLMYDLANLYLQIGDSDNAYKSFLEIYGINTSYRDVQDKIKELEEAQKAN